MQIPPTFQNRAALFPATPIDYTQRGGPDFSCFVITKECHSKYKFDENFAPAFFEDNDFHRQVELGGDGDRIFSINVPYLHYGSQTIKQWTGERREKFDQAFVKCREYYVSKWGGMPHHETFDRPFGGKS